MLLYHLPHLPHGGGLVGHLELAPGQEPVLVPVDGLERVLADDRKVDELLHLNLAISPSRQMGQDSKHLKIAPESTLLSIVRATLSWEMSILFIIFKTLNISLSVNSPLPLGSNLWK